MVLKKKMKGIFMENSLLKWPLQSFLICSMMSLKESSKEQKLALFGFRQQSSETNYV
jgi:hypothetical protein